MFGFIPKQHRRFGYALRGICDAFCIDSNFMLQVLLILPFSLVAYLAWPLTYTELMLLFGSYCLILITELQNTSFERALDRLHPEHHDDIGASKDIAAGAVLVAGIFALAVILTILTSRLG